MSVACVYIGGVCRSEVNLNVVPQMPYCLRFLFVLLFGVCVHFYVLLFACLSGCQKFTMGFFPIVLYIIIIIIILALEPGARCFN